MPIHSVDAGAWRVRMQLMRKRMEVEEIRCIMQQQRLPLEESRRNLNKHKDGHKC